MDWLPLILFPLIGALIGWLTNRLAIHCLFRPQKPVRLGVFSFQGLIPKRRKALAEAIANVVERELITTELIREELQQAHAGELLEKLVRRLVHEKLAQMLMRIPLLGSMVNEERLAQLERYIVDELRREADPMLDNIAADMAEHINISRLVTERIEAFDLDKIEALSWELAHKEFRFIEALGFILGLFVGLVQAGIYAIGIL